MAKRVINTGTAANDKTGDSLRDAATKINDNFQEVYYYLGDGTNLTVAAVAKTGSYNSLTDTPNLGSYVLKTQAFSGNYNDLTNKPTFTVNYNELINKPDLTQFQTKSEAFTGDYQALTNKPDFSIYALKSYMTWGNVADKPTFSTVAYSGDYNELQNRPTLFSGSYTDLTGAPDLSVYQLAAGAFNGDYNSLLNRPTLFSGSYTDLTNKPVIAADVSDLTDSQGLLSRVLSTQGVVADTTGQAVTIAVQNANPNWQTALGVTVGDMTLDINVDEINGAIITVVNGGDNHSVGESGTISGTVMGAATPDDLQYTITAVTTQRTDISLDKQVIMLSDGEFNLANGVEGQILYLAVKSGTLNAASIAVHVSNGRVNSTTYADILYNPFANGSNLVTLIFTEGAWQSIGGLWD